jgi:poly(3-hydroxybutyrate) depolymerase
MLRFSVHHLNTNSASLSSCLGRRCPAIAAIMAGVAGACLVLLAITAPSMAGAPDPAPAARSAGCGKSASPGIAALTTQDGNKTSRSYLVQIPAGYDSSRPYALIFVFHAAGGDPAQSRAWGLQNAAGASGNGIFVFPEGIKFQREGIGWDDRSDGYDLPLFDHMLEALEAGYCVDSARVFVAGFSWGGDFATALLCNRGDRIRAVAVNSVSDEYADKSDYRTYRDLPCPTHRHPPIRFEHAVGGDAQYPPPYFATTSKLFQTFNACSAASTPAPSSTPVMACASFNACRSEFVECSFDHAIGHTLPPNWAQDTWDFFSAQP